MTHGKINPIYGVTYITVQLIISFNWSNSLGPDTEKCIVCIVNMQNQLYCTGVHLSKKDVSN